MEGLASYSCYIRNRTINNTLLGLLQNRKYTTPGAKSNYTRNVKDMPDVLDGDGYPKNRRNVIFDYFRKITHRFVITARENTTSNYFCPATFTQ